jgi:hypothetical protein
MTNDIEARLREIEERLARLERQSQCVHCFETTYLAGSVPLLQCVRCGKIGGQSLLEVVI